jgi:hypothetical protein
LHYLYFGVRTGVYPSIVFLGLGAMTDFCFSASFQRKRHPSPLSGAPTVRPPSF